MLYHIVLAFAVCLACILYIAKKSCGESEGWRHVVSGCVQKYGMVAQICSVLRAFDDGRKSFEQRKSRRSQRFVDLSDFSDFSLAERGGFEPPRGNYPPAGIRSQSLQPLGYLSTPFPRPRDMGRGADSLFQGISLLILTYDAGGFKVGDPSIGENRPR